jgi:hypothetical protein
MIPEDPAARSHLPDPSKGLRPNMTVLATMLAEWAFYLVNVGNSLPDDARMLRMAARSMSGGLHYSANEARRIAAGRDA